MTSREREILSMPTDGRGNQLTPIGSFLFYFFWFLVVSFSLCLLLYVASCTMSAMKGA